MTNFKPGTLVKNITSKSGKSVAIRYPRWEDLDEMTRYINKISKENTYLNFSGEEVSIHEESKYLALCFEQIEMRNDVILLAFDGEKMIGSCTIGRIFAHRKRSLHVGVFGLSIEEDYRNDGVGYELAQATIDEARKNISGLRMLILDLFSENTAAKTLYEKLGFIEAGRIPGVLLYKDRYLDEVHMYRNL